MAVTAAMVKELRERTGAGMMDCKKVLVETDGDMEKAIEVLREKGLAKAAKKAGRVAAEGIVRTAFSEDGKVAVLVEVNSETDFVAKNPDFVTFVEDVATIVLEQNPADVEALLALEYAGEGTVKDALNGKIATIGENLGIRRFTRYEDPAMVYTGYIHGNNKVGVIIGVETVATQEEVNTLGRDVAMQVAAMSPKYVCEAEVDADYIAEESKILEQQVINEGKPAERIEGIVKGKIKKMIKEICLVEQKFVKNAEMTVMQYAKAESERVGKEMNIAQMVRYEVGEGIEKKEENFAEEVAKQMANK